MDGEWQSQWQEVAGAGDGDGQYGPERVGRQWQEVAGAGTPARRGLAGRTRKRLSGCLAAMTVVSGATLWLASPWGGARPAPAPLPSAGTRAAGENLEEGLQPAGAPSTPARDAADPGPVGLPGSDEQLTLLLRRTTASGVVLRLYEVPGPQAVPPDQPTPPPGPPPAPTTTTTTTTLPTTYPPSCRCLTPPPCPLGALCPLPAVPLCEQIDSAGSGPTGSGSAGNGATGGNATGSAGPGSTGSPGPGSTGSGSAGSGSAGNGATGGNATGSAGPGSAGSTGPGSAGSGTARTLIVEASDDAAVGEGTVTAASSSPGQLQVDGTGVLGVAEGEPAAWIVVSTGPQVAEVRLVSGAGVLDTTSPVQSVAVLATVGATALAADVLQAVGSDGSVLATLSVPSPVPDSGQATSPQAAPAGASEPAARPGPVAIACPLEVPPSRG